VYGSGAVVLAWSLLIRRAQRARRQAEIPHIVLCKFPGPAQISPAWESRAGAYNARPHVGHIAKAPLDLTDGQVLRIIRQADAMRNIDHS